jgi:hypothetical protein
MLCGCVSCISIYQDKKKKYYIIIGILLEIFRISIACGLSVFVPQTCISDRAMCISLYKIVYLHKTNYTLFVICFNMSTFILFCLLFIIEIKRDEWIMKHFEYDTNESNTHINSLRSEYVTLFRKLHTYNIIYYRGYQVVAIIYFINVIISCIVLYQYYYDFTTITVLLTNVCICSSKLYNGLIVSKTSLDNNIPKCYFSKIFVSFNTIDNNYVIKNIDGPFFIITQFFSDTSCKSIYIPKTI